MLEAALAGPAPLGAVFLDDVHYADEASLDFLTYLARRVHDRPILMLFTWRSDEVDSSHRLRRLLAEAARAGFGTVETGWSRLGRRRRRG